MTPLPNPSSTEPVEFIRTGDYSEGPVIDREGNLYFSRLHAEVIVKVTPQGQAVTWAQTGRPNGHKILPNGEHLVCDAGHQAVLRLSSDGQILESVVSQQVEDLAMHDPNDLCLDPAGGFYFTNSVAEVGAVHFVDSLGRAKVVAGNIDFANGIVLSDDGRRLLVAESLKNRILAIGLDATGHALGKPAVFADLPRNEEKPGAKWNQPDGIALDQDGRLWVAHWGMNSIHVLDTNGQLMCTYDGGNVQTSNLCFGGDSGDTLYVTGGDPGAVFRLEVGVRGQIQ